MLFPEEIFDLILKQHKKNHIKKILNHVINHRLVSFNFNLNCYMLTIKKLEISIYNCTFNDVLITYYWKGDQYVNFMS